MKMADVALAARYAEVLRLLPAARKAYRPDRKPEYSGYTTGLEIGYFEGDDNGGSSDSSVHLPLRDAAGVLDFVEALCRDRLNDLGVGDA